MLTHQKIESYFKSFNFWVYFILLLCFLGVFRNTVFLHHFGLNNNLTHIFWAMIAIYAAQILLMLSKMWMVWIVSLIQIGFCIYVFPDFSITPLSAVLQFLFFDSLKESSFAWAHFINFMFVSFGFSTEIIKTYLLYIYFPRPNKQELTEK